VTRQRKSVVSRKGPIPLRSDVQEAIARAWLDGIVEMSFDPDESYFHEVHPKLAKAFAGIGNAQLVRERTWDGGPKEWHDSDTDECPPDDLEYMRSYHLFFVSPTGEAFTFEEEAEPESIDEEFEEDEWDEGPVLGQTAGTGRTGWVVAVSLLAPFGVIELGDDVSYEDGTATELQIETCAETLEGEPIVDHLEHFRKNKGDRAHQTLVKLREEISAILEKCGITVLPAEEWRKPVSELRAGSDTLIGDDDGKSLRVLDAFFFAQI
jgi:hypothetical protein